MPEQDARSEDAMQNASKPPRHGEEQSATIAEQAIRRAAEDIKEEIDATESLPDARTLQKKFSTWVKTQVDRLSRAVVALMAAALVTLLMPFLVKLEMVGEIEGLTNKFNNLLESSGSPEIYQNTLSISEKTKSIENQNADILKAFSTLGLQVSDLAETAQSDGRFESIQTDIGKVLDQHSDKLESILASTTNSAPGIEKNGVISSALLAKKISGYLKDGRTFMRAGTDSSIIEAWIGEVYYFISVLPSDRTELGEIKGDLRKIYLSEKPFTEQTYRMSQTLLILEALKNWADIAT